MSDKRFTYKIDDCRHTLLILGIFPLVVFIIMDGMDYWPVDTPTWVESIIREYRNAFVPWFFVLALMAYGRRLLNFSNRFLQYFAEGSYPLYILHQTAVVLIAFFIVQWDLGVVVKYIIIVALAFIIANIIYDVLVRRTNITRFLFGMKPLKK
jgi:peptidoglycan/LPS O-acetylase OafA/YrhL